MVAESALSAIYFMRATLNQEASWCVEFFNKHKSPAGLKLPRLHKSVTGSRIPLKQQQKQNTTKGGLLFHKWNLHDVSALAANGGRFFQHLVPH